MFGSIGGPEILLLFLLALLLFGPRKLPEIGRTIGRAVGEFRRATTEFRTSLEREVELEQFKELRNDVRAAVTAADPGPVRPPRAVPAPIARSAQATDSATPPAEISTIEPTADAPLPDAGRTG